MASGEQRWIAAANYLLATVPVADAHRPANRDRWSMSELAGALDVRDHRFGAGAPFTVGIEEEYMLLDPETFGLVPGAERILEAERDGVYAEHIAPELFDSLVEFHTGVCATIADAAAEL